MVYSFSTFDVDAAGRELRHDGKVVEVEPKVFDLLLYLIEHRDRVVPKDELFDTLWPNVVVAPAALTSCVTRLRRALAESNASAETIRTFHRHGYRFIATLNADGAIAAPTHPPLPEVRPTAVPRTNPSEPYLGREQELTQVRGMIESLMAAAASGQRPQALFLRGDAGIGKSRTLDEAVRYAAECGAEVLMARCYEGEGAGGFWPWVRILRACAQQREIHSFALLAGGGAAEIARVVPSLREILPALPTLDGRSGDEARAPFFDAVTNLLANAAATRPLVLVFDDLHWADAASLLLLQFVIHEMPNAPLLILGAYRPIEAEAPHPLAVLLAALQREERCQVVTLGPLAADAAYAMLRSLAGADVDVAIATKIIETTERNPLFIGEYWRDLVERGAVQLYGARWAGSSAGEPSRVPDGVKALIGRRLHGLSSICTEHLTLAAVAGREFTFDLLLAATRAAREVLLDSLDEGIDAHVIVDANDVVGRYRFTHALLRETLYESLSVMRRAEWHARVGNALLELGAAESEEGQPDLAYHLVQAAAAGNTDIAIEHARRAAERSTAVLAYEDAVRWFERALSVFEGRPVRGDGAAARRMRSDILLALGEACDRSGEGERARRLFYEVANLSREDGDAERLARAVLGLTTRWTFDDPQLITLLKAALAAVGESELRIPLLGRLAIALYQKPDTAERRAALCDEALTSARRTRAATVIANALADNLGGLWHTSNVRQQLQWAEEIAELAPQTGDPRLALTADVWRIVALLGLGQIRAADAVLSQFSVSVAAARLPTFRWYATYLEAGLHLVRGRLADAERTMQEAFALGQRISESGALYVYRGQLFALRREQGRLAELEVAFTAGAIDPGNLNVIRWPIPYFFSELGRDEQARAIFAAAAADGFADVPPENARNTRLSALSGYAEVCGNLAARESAGRLYEMLEPYDGLWAVLGWGAVTTTAVKQSLAVLAGVLGRWDEAGQRFDKAIEEAKQQDAVMPLLRSQHNHARLLLARGRPRDRGVAGKLVGEALDLSQRYGIPAFHERLSRLQERAQTAPRRRGGS